MLGNRITRFKAVFRFSLIILEILLPLISIALLQYEQEYFYIDLVNDRYLLKSALYFEETGIF